MRFHRLRAALTGMLAGVGMLSAEAKSQAWSLQTLTNPDTATLYDVQLGAFRSNRAAQREMRRIQSKLPSSLTELRPYIMIEKDGLYRVVLNADFLHEHAQDVRNAIRPVVRNAFVKPSLTPATEQATLLTSGQLERTIQTYTAVFGSSATFIRSLRNADGRFVRVPISSLRLPYQLDLKSGTDFRSVPLPAGQTIATLASTYTRAEDLELAITTILKFNGIEASQEGRLPAGSRILIPSALYHEPGTVISTVEERPKTTRERELERRLPTLVEASDYRDDINRQSLYVLANTTMPAVLIETFNLQNAKQRNFYNDPLNQDRLIRGIADGVTAYFQNRHGAKGPLKEYRVIVDDGHGKVDPGSIACRIWRNSRTFICPSNDIIKANGEAVNETDYTHVFQRKLVAELRERGFTTRALSSSGRQRQRLNEYVDEANNFAKPVGSARAVYVALHADSKPPQRESGPDVRVHNRGRQPRSTELGMYILFGVHGELSGDDRARIAEVVAADTARATVPVDSLDYTALARAASRLAVPRHVVDYVAANLPHALLVEQVFGYPAAGVLAKSGLETGFGTQPELMDNARNYFGMKCKDEFGNRFNGCYTKRSAEFTPSNIQTSQFVIYATAAESFEHFGEFLDQRVSSAFKGYEVLLRHNGTPRDFLVKLAATPYSTDLREREKLLAVLDKYHVADLVAAAIRK